jgi:drug/metabolite transporter (DMT)-like permease
MGRSLLLLALGVFACSTAAILIKASSTHPAVLASVRLLLAAGLLLPIFLREWRLFPDAVTPERLRRSILPAAVLAAHFISWAWGARLTLSAQASLIVNLAPVAIPFFLHWLVNERVNRREIIGTVVAIGGVTLLSVRDALAGGGDLLGNLVCFGSMLLFACYLALGRRNRDLPSLWLYVVPIYFIAGLICAVVAIPWWTTLDFGSTRELSLLAGLAVIPTIVGHTLLNRSMRQLRGQVVSVCNVGQFLFAGMMAYFFFGEIPPPLFYAASGIVLAGIGIVVFSAPSPPPRLR